jgi:hypothetical protein
MIRTNPRIARSVCNLYAPNVTRNGNPPRNITSVATHCQWLYVNLHVYLMLFDNVKGKCGTTCVKLSEGLTNFHYANQ